MFRKTLVLLFIVILSLPVIYSTNSLSCELRLGGCNIDETPIFWTSNDLSAHVRISSETQAPYEYAMCCSSPYSSLGFRAIDSTQSCGSNSEELLYFTGAYNARISSNYTSSHHPYKLCFEIPDGFSTMDLLISEETTRFQNAGYECLFKVSAEENGVVSSCDASFDDGDQYQYTAWGRLFENLNSLKCNSDCTSKLDGRVYSACSQKIAACERVPAACDGSILESWVELDSESEIQCSPSWDKTRDKVFTTSILDVESTGPECRNLISIKETVFIDNEPVIMNIFVCTD